MRYSTQELRKFGVTLGICFAFIGLILLLRKSISRSFFMFAVSFILILSGLIYQKLLSPVYKIWMTFANIMGWIMTRFILLILFYLVVTPIGICMRLFGKNSCNIRFDKTAQSYWIHRSPIARDLNSYEKQF